MNVYIMADLEGISGIYSCDQVTGGASRRDEGRKYMTRDVNTCVTACKDAGAEKVYVRDAHGGSDTLLWEKLTPLADYYICGAQGQSRMPGLTDCDFVILLGYHARAGSEYAVLEHSMSSGSIQNYYINGKLAGEVAIDAGIAGDIGKRVILVSGDDKVCAEAKEVIPGVVTAEMKKGISSFGAMLLPCEKAQKILYEKTIEAIQNAGRVQPVIFEKPINFRVEHVERINNPSLFAKPYMKIIDGRTFEVEGDTVEEALSRSW